MTCWATIASLLRTRGACAMVTVAGVEGSAPRECGARMIVTVDEYSGTIGGGALEWRAMAVAQAMLAKSETHRISDHALGPELGQCCGGRVTLYTEIFRTDFLHEAEKLAERETRGPFELAGRIVSPSFVEHFGEDRRHLYLFGAGHVGRALVLALAPLPFAVHWIDPRPNAFPKFAPQNAEMLSPADVIATLANSREDSFVLIMTHSHALDLAITAAALTDLRFSYVGLIGSATKRARFERRLRDGGIPEERVKALVCPIGMPGIKAKLPAIIAAATVAELLAHDELLRSTKNPVNMPEWPARLAR